MATQAAARVQTPPMPRTARVARRKPTGRYVYESSSDEEDAEEAPWRPAPRVRGMLDPDALDSDAEEAESPVEADTSSASAHDARSLRLANELDPWDAWEQLCRRRAWVRPRERPPRARTQSMTPAPRDESDVQELESMLSRFQLQQREVERKEREAFEQRNTRLWDGIERAIREAETRAAHEAEQLAHARRRQEQAEAEARRAREAELRRIEAEKRAEEERREREAQKQRELAELEKKEGAYNTMRGGERVWRTAASEYGAWRDRMLVREGANRTWLTCAAYQAGCACGDCRRQRPAEAVLCREAGHHAQGRAADQHAGGSGADCTWSRRCAALTADYDTS